jgi:hypothetical protein
MSLELKRRENGFKKFAPCKIVYINKREEEKLIYCLFQQILTN